MEGAIRLLPGNWFWTVADLLVITVASQTVLAHSPGVSWQGSVGAMSRSSKRARQSREDESHIFVYALSLPTWGVYHFGWVGKIAHRAGGKSCERRLADMSKLIHRERQEKERQGSMHRDELQMTEKLLNERQVLLLD